MKKSLNRTERFSTGFVKRLRELNPKKVESALGKEPRHKSKRLIEISEVKLLIERRNELIGHVDRLVLLHGKEAVLVFP